MATVAIVHTATRVVRRLTRTSPPPLASDESAIVVPDDFDLAGGPWKLDLAGQKQLPTSAEIDVAGIDEDHLHARQLQRVAATRTALDDLLTDPIPTPVKLKAFLTLLRQSHF